MSTTIHHTHQLSDRATEETTSSAHIEVDSLNIYRLHDLEIVKILTLTNKTIIGTNKSGDIIRISDPSFGYCESKSNIAIASTLVDPEKRRTSTDLPIVTNSEALERIDLLVQTDKTAGGTSNFEQPNIKNIAIYFDNLSKKNASTEFLNDRNQSLAHAIEMHLKIQKTANELNHMHIVELKQYGLVKINNRDCVFGIYENGGMTLNDWLVFNNRNGKSLNDKIQMMKSAANFIDLVNSTGISICDVKPSNMLVSTEETFLRFCDMESATYPNRIVRESTPLYSSYEVQLNSRAIAFKSDQYSYALVLYRVFIEEIKKSQELKQIILKGTDKDPGERFSNSAELYKAFIDVLQNHLDL